MTRWLAAMVSILLGMVVLTGAGPTRTTAVWQPARTTTWQWQITGRVHESVKAQMFDIDLFDARPGEINAGIVGRLHARRVKVVC